MRVKHKHKAMDEKKGISAGKACGVQTNLLAERAARLAGEIAGLEEKRSALESEVEEHPYADEIAELHFDKDWHDLQQSMRLDNFSNHAIKIERLKRLRDQVDQSIAVSYEWQRRIHEEIKAAAAIYTTPGGLHDRMRAAVRARRSFTEKVRKQIVKVERRIDKLKRRLKLATPSTTDRS